jgi:hypothetical protein
VSGQVNSYIRVYYSIITDPKFVGVFSNNDHLATWLRLLLAADAIYPAPAPIPRSAEQASLDVLVEHGIIAIVGYDHFGVVGLTAERERRSAAGKKAAGKRWGENADPMREQYEGIGWSDADPMLERDETRLERDETRVVPRASFGGPGDALVSLLASWGVMGLPLTAKLATTLDALVEDYGEAAVREQFEWVKGDKLNREAGQFIWGASKALRLIPSPPKSDPELAAQHAKEDAAAKARKARRREPGG